MLYLENSWSQDPEPAGTLHFTLSNLSDQDFTDFALCMTTITRIVGEPELANARFGKRDANYHRLLPPEGFRLASGESWSFSVASLNKAPRHRNDAAKTAWLTLTNGQHIPVATGDLLLKDQLHDTPAPLLSDGNLTLPFALLPWPNFINAEPGEAPLLLWADESSSLTARREMLNIGNLHARLFATARRVFALTPTQSGKALHFAEDCTLAPEAYHLQFGGKVELVYSDAAGLRYGLTALAQMLHGAWIDRDMKFPASGEIKDKPRYGWRGCHLDVSRHFWTLTEVRRVIDIMAWHKLNLFHWHLTDDEAWRAEILAFPELTTTGVTRSPDLPAMLPQLGDGIKPRGGFYSQDEMRDVITHAANLGIDVMPEIDMPGHCATVLASYPDMADPDEKPNSYHPVQGYPNNALNPAMAETWDFVEKVLDELCALFPSRYFHIGGDEVPQGAWLESLRARVLMQREGLAGTFELQSWFMRRLQNMLAERGKIMVGWNEVARGGGVSPESALLMAWENPEVGIELAREGYDVVMTPGQAYYLDMVQGDEWMANGAGWAGTVPPEHSYHYEAEGDFPADLRNHMRGVQACIWCEHFSGTAWFNHMVFPRLSAVAEAGWTEKANKDWLRFARQVRLHPKL